MRPRAGSRLAAASLGLALLSGACTYTSTVMDLDCGAVSLRFEEQYHFNESVNPLEYRLLVRRGWHWVEVSRDRGSGLESYSRLLPPEVGFRSLETSDQRAGDPSLRNGSWTVFMDPAVVTRAEYDVISSCLARNLAPIDHAFAAHKRLGHPRPRLGSVVYAAYDLALVWCGPRTLGSRWDCDDGRAYIKTVPQFHAPLVLCAVGPGEQTSEMPLADISPDQKGVLLEEPFSYDPTLQELLVGKDPKAYYATCRAANGRGFFEEFALARDVSSIGRR